VLSRSSEQKEEDHVLRASILKRLRRLSRKQLRKIQPE
jgi:hypothetical protein